MPKVLVSNNSELLRHFTAPPFQRLDLQLVVARSPDEAHALYRSEQPALAVIDAEPGGFDTARAIKADNPSTRVVLIAARRLSVDQMRQVSISGCDELLIAPMTADELHDVVAIQLGEPRLGTEAFSVAVKLAGKQIDATVSNLSIDGVRLMVGESVTEGQVLELAIAPPAASAGGFGDDLARLPGRVHPDVLEVFADVHRLSGLAEVHVRENEAQRGMPLEPRHNWVRGRLLGCRGLGQS